MKEVARENGFTYVPHELRTPKKLVFETDMDGKVMVSTIIISFISLDVAINYKKQNS